MEKFTKFRDPGTGIAPFLPIAPGSRTPFIVPVELALCIVRVPLIFLLLGLEAVFVEVVGEMCLRSTAPVVQAWLRWLFLRSILLLCGVWWVDEQLDGVSKSCVSFEDMSLLSSQRKLAVPPKPGNIIVSNFTSPLDIIYFAAKHFVCLRELTLGMTPHSFPALFLRIKFSRLRFLLHFGDR
jgi:1-acylglycerol-3-phosphate O-acyltransferase